MTERENFDAAMKQILSVSKEELQRRIEAAKERKAFAPAIKTVQRRVAKHVKSVSRVPASS